jgi:hypothetical protein
MFSNARMRVSSVSLLNICIDYPVYQTKENEILPNYELFRCEAFANKKITK